MRLPEMTAVLPLVGRERIVARAEQLLDEKSGGIVLVGEGGIGKSHIAREVLRLGAERGYATASTVGTLAAAGIPLGALSHLLPDLAAPGGNVLVAARTALMTATSPPAPRSRGCHRRLPTCEVGCARSADR